MEIERKFLIEKLPEDLGAYPKKEIRQGYISEDPVIRVRQCGGEYVLTVKGQGLICREETNLPLSRESFDRLWKKTGGGVIEKTRFGIPCGKYLIELDAFHGKLEGLLLAEVEFGSEEEAKDFTAPAWFGKEVTYDPAYQNVNLRKKRKYVHE